VTDVGQAEDGPPVARAVSNVETLKALADPVRLAILGALMDETHGPQLRVLSVKELAEELGEPQTKLYRHVRQLEAAGLIRVAATRMVSGIVEQRYQACQRDLQLGPGLLRDWPSDEMEPVVTAVLDRYRDRFFAAHRAGLISTADFPPAEAYRKSMLTMAETRLSASRAAAIRLKLKEILDELAAADHDQEEDGDTPVSLLIGFFSPLEPPGAAKGL
jgi:DNA-binding transcriptional ArsR family regulator